MILKCDQIDDRYTTIVTRIKCKEYRSETVAVTNFRNVFCVIWCRDVFLTFLNNFDPSISTGALAYIVTR